MARPSELIVHESKKTYRRIDRDTFERLCRIGMKESLIVDFFGCDRKTLSRWIKKEYGNHETFAHIRDMYGAECFISVRQTLLERAKFDTKACIYLDEKLNAKYADSDVSASNQLAEAIEKASRVMKADVMEAERYRQAQEEELEDEDE